MDVILVLVAVGDKLQLKYRDAVVVVKFPFFKHRVLRPHVGPRQRNLPRFFQRDIRGRLAIPGVGGVVIVAADGHHAGGQAEIVHGVLRGVAHALQEIIAGEGRTGFHPQDDVPFVSVQVVRKAAGLVHLHDDIVRHLAAVFSDIVRIRLDNRDAVFVLAGQGDHPSVSVVRDADFGEGAQHQASHRLRGGVVLRQRGAAHQKSGHKDGQGRNGRQYVFS